MAGSGETVSNMQVLFKNYESGFPKESDMYVATTTTELKVPEEVHRPMAFHFVYPRLSITWEWSGESVGF
ncbi:hypothetical protein OIU84_029133 [Salix udensis]|uniref:Uncharacterized protein n=1 Tax=Salix udensis TaxID=889485 RepID=A0AAD6K8R5_9ROSI|nr:hypothetical protein OIU84_029133 [Salix udensis]